ncbi:MAG: sulfotransferase family protein [Rhodothermales bacterium]|nr:sulfotransferase family protein [Rhodothermales bacterium]
MKRICLWSGPRNVSTALMYAFAQRSDTTVVDEPLYGAYLSLTGLPHPGAQVVVDNMQNDASKVIKEVFLGDYETEAVFIKSMAHHLFGLPSDFLDHMENVILTRDPEEMLPSLINQIPEPELRDTALPAQIELLQRDLDAGKKPIVLDARELLLDPGGVLTQLCNILDVDFLDHMLHWEAGPKSYDGVWAPFWYHNVHRSTGFAEYKRKEDPFPDRLRPLLEQTAPMYDQLYAYALRASN